MTDVAILSALYQSYEWVKPAPPNLGVPALMMTDDPDLDAPGWQARVHSSFIDDDDENFWDPAATIGMMRHKFWKTHPGLAFQVARMAVPDVVIWLDASMTIVSDTFVERCLEALGDDDWSVTPHPSRTCIFDEAEFSAHLARYDARSVRDQATFYSSWHPANWGLFATGASVRRLTPIVKEVGEQWWWECSTRTHQDQVSLPVLFRLYEEKGLKWNKNMPWGGGLWELTEHGR